jgi:hypothetical protein
MSAAGNAQRSRVPEPETNLGPSTAVNGFANDHPGGPIAAASASPWGAR